MNKDQEFRRLADEAQSLADRAKNTSARDAWTRIAVGWRGLVGGKRAAESAALGTKPEESGSTHLGEVDMKLILIASALLVSTAALADDCKMIGDGSVRVWQCAPTPAPPADEKK
jgi:hypothetical protein